MNFSSWVIRICLAACSLLTLSLPRSNNPALLRTTPQTLLASIEFPDLRTLTLRPSGPSADFLYELSFLAFRPHCPSSIRQYSGGGYLIPNPVGTGPFCFIEWRSEDRITLECNENP
jgi:ABC-type transport system substrate-binding protein